MKKIISVLITAAMLAGLAAVGSFAYDPVNYEIPKAAAAPTIDGAFGNGEWDNALTIDMAASKLNFIVDANPALGENSKFCFMWDDTALYYIAQVDDNSVPDIVPTYGDALNSGDGIQFGIFGPTGGAAGDGTGHLFFSNHPKTDNGQPDCYEHFNIVEQIANDKYGAKIASTFQSDSAYTVEGSIPWSVFATIYANGFVDDIKGVAGQVLRISCVIMEANGGDQSLAHSGGWFNFDETDIFTLANTPAGYIAPEIPGYASAAEAAAGKNVITGYTFISGSEGFGSEGPENLFDGNTGTKFCTATFPCEAVAQLDGIYDINGFTMATANDNADYNGRSPQSWTISVSSDGSNWTTLASGDDSFFAETNFTYYVGDASASGISYVKFSNDGTASGTFQVSELTLFGNKTGDFAAPAAAEAAPAPAAEPASEPAPSAAPVAEAAPAAAAPAAQTSDMAGIAVLTAVAALGAAVVIGKKH